MTDFKAQKGMGVTAKFEDQVAFIGNERLLGDDELTTEQQQTLHDLQAQGKTVSLVGLAGKVIGMIAIQDAPETDF